MHNRIYQDYVQAQELVKHTYVVTVCGNSTIYRVRALDATDAIRKLQDRMPRSYDLVKSDSLIDAKTRGNEWAEGIYRDKHECDVRVHAELVK